LGLTLLGSWIDTLSVFHNVTLDPSTLIIFKLENPSMKLRGVLYHLINILV